MPIYHPFIPKFLWLWLASRAVSEVRTVCVLPTAWSNGDKRALNNVLFWFPYWCMLFPSALCLLELFCLPGINCNWEQSLAPLVASVLGESMSGQWPTICWQMGQEGWRYKSLLGFPSEFHLVLYVAEGDILGIDTEQYPKEDYRRKTVLQSLSFQAY